jgi:hypothetical protein
VVGSREFVNEAFAREREPFTAKRKDGSAPAAGALWSLRDLQVRV